MIYIQTEGPGDMKLSRERGQNWEYRSRRGIRVMVTGIPITTRGIIWPA